MFHTPVTILFSWYERICDLPDEQIEQQLNELSRTNPQLVAELRSLLAKESQPDSLEVLASIEIAGSEQRPTSGRQVVMPGDIRDLTKAFEWDEAKGSQKLGCFLIRECLSLNVTGATYRAFDEDMQREVAIFFWYPRLVANRFQRSSRLRAARLVGKLFHPNVATTLGIIEHEQTIGIVRQWIPGVTLAQWMAARQEVAIDKVIEIGRDIALGISALHQAGVLHRDLKPSNIVVDASGKAVIIDFGTVSRFEGDSERMIPVGTPGFIAPEVLAGMAADRRSDLYALGAVLYWLCTGHVPEAKITPLIPHGISDRMSAETVATVQAVFGLVNELLQSSPELRPVSIDEVLKRLDPTAYRHSIATTPARDIRERVLVYRLSSRRRWLLHAGKLVLTAGASFVAGRSIAKWIYTDPSHELFLHVPATLPQHNWKLGYTDSDRRGIREVTNALFLRNKAKFLNSDAWLIAPSVPHQWCEVSLTPILLPIGKCRSNLITYNVIMNAKSGEAVVELQCSRTGEDRSWLTLSRIESRFEGIQPISPMEQLMQDWIVKGGSLHFKVRMLTTAVKSEDEIGAVNLASVINNEHQTALEFSMWE